MYGLKYCLPWKVPAFIFFSKVEAGKYFIKYQAFFFLILIALSCPILTRNLWNKKIKGGFLAIKTRRSLIRLTLYYRQLWCS
jgi:hypothetical protein